MNGIIGSIKNFFHVLDFRLIMSGLLMIIISALIVYVFIVAIGAFKERREAIKVSLPNVDDIGKSGPTKVQFKDIDDFAIELIETETDENNYKETVEGENQFLTALSIETGQFIPANNIEANMPEVGEIDYEEIKQRKAKEEQEKSNKELQRIREFAMVDNEGEVVAIEDELMSDMNKYN